MISIAFNLAYNENKQYKILGYWFKDLVSFVFLEKGMEMLHSISSLNSIAWLGSIEKVG